MALPTWVRRLGYIVLAASVVLSLAGTICGSECSRPATLGVGIPGLIGSSLIAFIDRASPKTRKRCWDSCNTSVKWLRRTVVVFLRTRRNTLTRSLPCNLRSDTLPLHIVQSAQSDLTSPTPSVRGISQRPDSNPGRAPSGRVESRPALSNALAPPSEGRSRRSSSPICDRRTEFDSAETNRPLWSVESATEGHEPLSSEPSDSPLTEQVGTQVAAPSLPPRNLFHLADVVVWLLDYARFAPPTQEPVLHLLVQFIAAMPPPLTPQIAADFLLTLMMANKATLNWQPDMLPLSSPQAPRHSTLSPGSNDLLAMPSNHVQFQPTVSSIPSAPASGPITPQDRAAPTLGEGPALPLQSLSMLSEAEPGPSMPASGFNLEAANHGGSYASAVNPTIVGTMDGLRQRTVYQTVGPTATTDRPYPCEDCPREFSRTIDLFRHRASKHPHDMLPQECPYPGCQRPFTRKGALKRHQDRLGHHV